jgi:DNA-binding CsgD family transcriptional regulator
VTAAASPVAGDLTAAADVVATAVGHLATPGLVVLAGPPGIGRTGALRRIGAAFRGPVFTGGGLAMLSTAPGLALARAVRVRLPVHDPALLAEAVRSRVRTGLLALDDLQWADPATLAALPVIAAHCRVVVALRTPHRLPPAADGALRAAAAAWLPVPPLPADTAAALARQLAPAVPDRIVADLVRRAGGVPLAVATLARQAAAHRDTGPAAGDDTGRLPAQPTTAPPDGAAGSPGTGAGPAAPQPTSAPPADPLAYAVATALADLARPARTAMAALGLLGRPAAAVTLGDGVAELLAAGLAEPAGGAIAPVSPFVAEVAAGLLADAERRALHRRLADLVPPAEAARHLAAAGESQLAYRAAVTAAQASPSSGERSDLLLLACGLPGVDSDPPVRLAAARAAVHTGRPRAALRVLATAGPGHAAAVLRGEALLQVGDTAAAVDAVAGVPDGAPPDLLGARDRVRLLGLLAADPTGAVAALDAILARHGDPPPHPGLRAAVAAVRAAARQPGWEYGLASAAAAGGADDPLAARWSAWLLVEALAADGRLAEAAQAASAAAQACAADLAYSWQTRFLAAGLWCAALRGDGLDEVARRAGDLLDRSLPSVARGYAAAAASLAEADGGLLAPARARLAAAGAQPPSTAAALDWVAREAAWLDGQPGWAAAPPAPGAPPLLDGLRWITARWAAHDTAAEGGLRPAAPVGAGDLPAAAGGAWDPLSPADAGDRAVPGTFGHPAASGGELPPPAGAGRIPPLAQTVHAWADPGRPGRFDGAAAAWQGLSRREEVRCLLARGLLEPDPPLAVPALLRAEQLAGDAGLVVLLGRVRRTLRRHAVRREARGRRAGDDLTDRERDVLRLVARGEPTRRIAGQLGISRETVETHIRAGMRKLGARTRTEAAALALEVLA